MTTDGSEAGPDPSVASSGTPRPGGARGGRDGPAPAVVVRLLRAMSRAHTAVYRATGGRVGREAGGMAVCVLTTKGRRTGERRATTLAYVEHGDAVLVVPANAGAARLPGWYHNLVAEPRVLVQVGRRVRRMRARTAGPEERARLWPRVVAASDVYERHQQRRDRPIPVVVLDPLER